MNNIKTMTIISKAIAFCIIMIQFSLCFVVYAHPGDTDANGGHYDRETGEYHYHHGYPAHQHENGECPYDFDDKTGENSGSTVHSNDSLNKTFFSKHFGLTIIIIIVIICVLVFLIRKSFLSIRRKIRRKRCDEYLKQLKPKVQDIHNDYDRIVEKERELFNNLNLEVSIAKLNYRKYLYDYYSKRLLEDECNAPEDIKFENGTFISSLDKPYGKYTVYVTEKGKHFHKEYNCCGATISKVSFLVYGEKTPCSKCFEYIDKTTLYRPDWYIKYKKVLSLFIQFGVSQSKILQKEYIVESQNSNKTKKTDNTQNIKMDTDETGQMRII